MFASSICFTDYSFYHRKQACCSWADFNRSEIKLRRYLRPNEGSTKTNQNALSLETRFCGEETQQGISKRKWAIHSTLIYRKKIFISSVFTVLLCRNLRKFLGSTGLTSILWKQTQILVPELLVSYVDDSLSACKFWSEMKDLEHSVPELSGTNVIEWIIQARNSVQ